MNYDINFVNIVAIFDSKYQCISCHGIINLFKMCDPLDRVKWFCIELTTSLLVCFPVI